MTIQSQTGPSGTKTPQVAVIPPLMDLTRVAEEEEEGKSKDENSEGRERDLLHVLEYE